ncbi:DUF1127 domain-containing protein [Paucibacter sp. TC2R-5]|uniref:DUF1127 domain-containing protein n=1 Tax=Paucibacter sp. TC2R-5 TaxID=2893555 RepID=UPI0021E3AF27|nr:DUF1127 domain-containing protein [Paucibacter sp. TC2R-5]MCV2359886.1 DUF1127 domain-containing protein [Paucibacter sp. TC2R-5]
MQNLKNTFPLLQCLYAAWLQRRRNARMRAELLGLEGRELADLGVGRGELEFLLLHKGD